MSFFFNYCFPFRYLHDDLYEMTCTLQIDAQLLRESLAYKYVIFSPAAVTNDDCYEFLHFAANLKQPYYDPDPNRCLWFIEDQRGL